MGSCALELPSAMGDMVAAPGGYCTAACEIDADCGAGSICAFTLGGTRCFKSCAIETDCRTDYVCGERGISDPPTIVCTPFEPDPDPDAGVPDGGMTDAAIGTTP